MKPSNVCLPKSEIPLLLSGDLSPDEVAAAENHIAECETCRIAIESMIADSRWWDDARHSLAASATRSADRADVAHDTEPTTNEQMLELLGPTDDPAMLGRIGVYEIVGILGHGGMGVVFKGYDGALNRFVAIKMLLPHLAASGAARKRFAREAQAAAAVVDDHVMAIHGVSEWKSVPYFVMPYARGVSLQKRLSNSGPLEVREILRIGMQAARGLAAAHAQGLVHRDVKPANIFLDEGVERVQLMDFGLARAVDDASLTRSGTLAGTPQYMSPEQARAETVDHLSDLFSLGSVMYVMCVGHAPFRAESSYSVLRLITDKEPRPIREINPEIPEWLCLIISKLMSKQTSDRFESAEGVAELLADCLAHVQQPSAVALPVSLVPRVSGRHSFFNSTRVGVITMLGTIGMTLLGMVLWQATEAPDISGQWTSDELGAVVLEAKAPGQYEGTFSGSGMSKTAPRNDRPRGGHGDGYDSFGGIPKSGSDTFSDSDPVMSGTLHLKWSRLERRFNGTWGKGAERRGTMSLRLVDNEIRGAWTTDEDVQLESGTPLLGDLLWMRSVVTVPDGGTVLLGGSKSRSEEDVDDWLAVLQGHWNVEQVHVDDGVLQRDVHTAFVHGKRMEIQNKDGQASMMFDFVLGNVGPPQQIDLKPVVSDIERQEMQDAFYDIGEQPPEAVLNPIFYGIIDSDGDTIRICNHARPCYPRPIQFTDSASRVIWNFTRRIENGHNDDVMSSGSPDRARPPVILPAGGTGSELPNAVERAMQYLSAVQQNDIETIKSIAKGMRYNDKRTKDMKTLLRENGIPKLHKSWFEKHSAVVALGPVTSSDEKMNGLFLLFTLSRDDERWSIVDIDLEAEQSLRDRFKVPPVKAVDEAHDGRAEERTEDVAPADETAKHKSVGVNGSTVNMEEVADEALSTDSINVRAGGGHRRLGTLTVTKPTSLEDAVSKFNDLAKTHDLGRKQSELTVDEMIGAFRLWSSRKECNKATRTDFQQVIDSQMLRPGHILQFNTEHETDGYVFSVWAIQFGDDDSYAWFKIRNMTLLSQLKSDDERRAWEQSTKDMAKSFRDHKRHLHPTPKAAVEQPQESLQ